MERARLVRILRIAGTGFCGVACVLSVSLWVRSYWRVETAAWTFSRTLMEFTSFRGQLGTSVLDYGIDMPEEVRGPKFDSSPVVEGTQVQYNDGTGRPMPSYLGFKSSWLSAPALRSGNMSMLVIPYWFPTALFGCMAAWPWIRSPWRFSLRTLLLAITLTAAGLGLVVTLRK